MITKVKYWRFKIIIVLEQNVSIILFIPDELRSDEMGDTL